MWLFIRGAQVGQIYTISMRFQFIPFFDSTRIHIHHAALIRSIPQTFALDETDGQFVSRITFVSTCLANIFLWLNRIRTDQWPHEQMAWLSCRQTLVKDNQYGQWGGSFYSDYRPRKRDRFWETNLIGMYHRSILHEAKTRLTGKNAVTLTSAAFLSENPTSASIYLRGMDYIGILNIKHMTVCLQSTCFDWKTCLCNFLISKTRSCSDFIWDWLPKA